MGIPSFSGHGEEKAREIVKWVERNLKPVKLTLAKTLELGVRTPEQIISSGWVSSAFSCLDKTAVIAALFKENGFDAFVVCEKVFRKGKSVGLHFLVEAADGKTRFSVEPTLYGTKYVSGWLPEIRSTKAGQTVFADKKPHHERLLKTVVPKKPMSLKAFNLLGIRNRRHYFALAKIGPRTFAKIAFAYMRKSEGLKGKKKKKKQKKRP